MQEHDSQKDKHQSEDGVLTCRFKINCKYLVLTAMLTSAKSYNRFSLSYLSNLAAFEMLQQSQLRTFSYFFVTTHLFSCFATLSI